MITSEPFARGCSEPLDGHRIDVESIAESGVLVDLEIAEVGFTRRGFVRPKHEHLAPMLGGVWAMLLAGFDMD